MVSVAEVHLGQDETLDAFYDRLEPQLLANSVVSQELADTGGVRLRTLQQQFGVSEGEAAFLSRQLVRTRGNQAKFHGTLTQQLRRDPAEGRDDYLYHVTTKRRLRQIMKQGLVPGSKPQFTNYGYYSGGRVFLAEKGGVPFWKERVEQHEEANSDRPSKVVVLRVLRDQTGPLLPDKMGTEDSRYPSYYIEQPIAPTNLELV
jgi:hypothetical protein